MYLLLGGTHVGDFQFDRAIDLVSLTDPPKFTCTSIVLK